MARGIAIVIVLALSCASGLMFAWLARGEARLVTPESLASAHQAEEALALQAGLVVLDRGTSDELPFEREVPLEPGQCVALVASLSGPDAIASTSITLASGRSTTSVPFVTHLAHHAICALEASTAAIALRAQPSVTPWAPRSVRFTILRGVPTRPRDYVRLDVNADERARFDEAAVRARLAEGHPERAIVPAVEVPREHAVLLPASRATFAAVRALVGRPGMVPTVDPAIATSDPFRVAAETSIPPRVFSETGLVRVIAVVDAGALAAAQGTPCVSVVLARLDDPREPVALRRIEVPSQAESLVAVDDSAIASDTVCPGQALRVYVADEVAGGRYVVSVHAVDGPPGASGAQASSFGSAPAGRRVVAPEPAPRLPVVVVTRSRASCESGSTADCLRWADLAAAGIDGAGDPRVPLERACELGAAELCDRLASVLAAAGDERAAELPERRACQLGSPAACLRRAARFREIGRFEEAFRTYRFGCSHGCAECCGAASTMQDWQLAAPVASVDSPP